MVKKKFRTLYDTQGYDGSEKGGGVDKTDPSEYVPTEVLIARFIGGDPTAGMQDPQYDHNSDPTDREAVDREFDQAEEEERFRDTIRNMGATELAKFQDQISRKLAQARKQDKKPVKKPSHDQDQDSQNPDHGSEPKPDDPARADKPPAVTRRA